MDKPARLEAEGAPSSADDADELVILGGGDVMKALVSALDEHLAALLDDLQEIEEGKRRDLQMMMLANYGFQMPLQVSTSVRPSVMLW